jgi:hypothetical protein
MNIGPNEILKMEDSELTKILSEYYVNSNENLSLEDKSIIFNTYCKIGVFDSTTGLVTQDYINFVKSEAKDLL